MEVALDTNCVIDLLNGSIDYTALKTEFTAFCIPVTVLGELLFGAEKSSRRQENYAKISAFAADCTILAIDAITAQQYAKTRKILYDNGTPIPENDIWIAAACLVRGIPLLTRDNHFNKVPELAAAAPGKIR